MANTLLLIGTLDTKGEEFAFIRDLIEQRGHGVLIVDVGVLDEPAIEADISATEVAEAGGSSLSMLRKEADRSRAIDVMIRGVRSIVPRLHAEGQFDGVLSLGGGGGTNIATAAMRELPVGVPKLMVSTLASSDVSPYVGVTDITMMYSVVDIEGINRLSRHILTNAVGSICGMVEQPQPKDSDRPLIAATMFGVTTPCVSAVRKQLELAGYEVVVFHATGTGGRAMEGLIADGFFEGVADITTTEWCDEVVGGVLSAGPHRLGAAGKAGVPQVVSCGALDMVNFHALETVPEQFQERNLFNHNPNVTLMRTSPEECKEIGQRIAEKLNEAEGPISVMLPIQGVSMIDMKGKPFYDPEANQALFDAFRTHLNAHVELIELDLHINDPAFAEAIANQLLQLICP